jgi:hypothetical protein
MQNVSTRALADWFYHAKEAREKGQTVFLQESSLLKSKFGLPASN